MGPEGPTITKSLKPKDAANYKFPRGVQISEEGAISPREMLTPRGLIFPWKIGAGGPNFRGHRSQPGAATINRRTCG